MSELKRIAEDFRAWLEGEAYTKILLQAYSPRNGMEGSWSWFDEWSIVKLLIKGGNPAEALDSFERWVSKTFFAGDGFPRFWINLGPGVVAAFLGAKPILKEDTVWFKGGYSWDRLERLSPNPEGFMWEVSTRLTAEASRRSRGWFTVGITDLGGITDVAAMLRGVDDFIVDMFKQPAKVEGLMDTVLECWLKAYELHSSLIMEEADYMSGWMGMLYPGRGYPVQCDVAYYMSPRLFERFGFKHLAKLCEAMDYPVYHLDGLGALPHLKTIARLPNLRAIQWVPGAGKPGREEAVWFKLYREILGLGLNLILTGVPPSSVGRLVDEFDCGRVLITTVCGSRREAERLAKLAGYERLGYTVEIGTE